MFAEAIRPRARQDSGVVLADRFLRRAFHSAGIAGRYIYIDGGKFSYQESNGSVKVDYMNTTLSLDLSKDWHNETAVFNSIDKTGDVPNLFFGALWYYQVDNVLFSGYIGDKPLLTKGQYPKNPDLTMWTLSPRALGGGVWDQVLNSSSAAWNQVQRTHQSLTAASRSSAWVLGGHNNDDYPVPGLIEFDMATKKFANLSSSDAGLPVTRGQLHFVSAFTPDGFLIAFGGTTIQTADERLPYDSSDGLITFETLPVFDLATRKWYNQTTTGTQPDGRVDFCVAGTASDNGTYEIFVYGGFNGRLEENNMNEARDTIHILSLPAFHWIHVEYPPSNPRHGMSCNAVGGSQMLVVGGARPQIDRDTDPDDSSAREEAIFRNPDPNKQGLGVFDLTTLTWKDHYIASPEPYKQSDLVKQYYSEVGPAATANLNPSIAALVQNKSANISNAPPQSSSSNPQRKAIAGGTIGAIVGLALILVIAWYTFKRRHSLDMVEKDSDEQCSGEAEMNGHCQHPELSARTIYEADNQPPELRDRNPPELRGRDPPELDARLVVQLGPRSPKEMSTEPEREPCGQPVPESERRQNEEKQGATCNFQPLPIL